MENTTKIMNFTVKIIGNNNIEETKDVIVNLIKLIITLDKRPSDYKFELSLLIEDFIGYSPFLGKKTYAKKIVAPLLRIMENSNSETISVESNFLPFYKIIYNFINDDICKKYGNKITYNFINDDNLKKEYNIQRCEDNYKNSRELKLQKLLQFSKIENFYKKSQPQANFTPIQFDTDVVIPQAMQVQKELGEESNTFSKVSSSFDVAIQQKQPGTKSACCLLI